MFNHLTNTQKGMLLAFGGYTAFAFSDASVKYVSTLGYSIYQIISVNTALACLLMLVFSPLIGGIKSLKDGKNAKVHAARIVLNTSVNLLVVYCFSIMPLASVYTAIFTLPFIAALISIPLFGEKIGIHRRISIVLGFAGILIAFQPWGVNFNLFEFLLPVGATVLIAMMFLAARFYKDTSPLAIGFYPVLGCCLLVTPLAIADFQSIILEHFPFFLISGVFMSLGIIGVSLAFKSTDSAAITPLLYSEMIWAILFGVLVFGDYPDSWMLIGAGIIILSGLYLVHRERSNP
mgnify:CR=1 FL=1